MKNNWTYFLTSFVFTFLELTQNISVPLEWRGKLYCKNNPNLYGKRSENRKQNSEDLLTSHLNCKSIEDQLDLQNSVQNATKLKINLPKPVLDLFNNLLSSFHWEDIPLAVLRCDVFCDTLDVERAMKDILQWPAMKITQSDLDKSLKICLRSRLTIPVADQRQNVLMANTQGISSTSDLSPKLSVNSFTMIKLLILTLL